MGGKLLAYMVKKVQLTPEDMAQLRAILVEHQQAAGEGSEAPP